MIKIKPRAIREIHAAASWWAENRAGAVGAIDEELQAAFQLLTEHSHVGTLVEGARDPNSRFFTLPRTRYCVYYRPRGSYLEILAFWHSAREKGPRV